MSINPAHVSLAAALHPQSKGFSFHILEGLLNFLFMLEIQFHSKSSIFFLNGKAIKPLTACPCLHLLNKTAFLLAVTFPVEAWITEPLDTALVLG